LIFPDIRIILWAIRQKGANFVIHHEDKKQLFRLTWPMFFEVVLFSVIGSVDVMMLSGYADNAVGGVGVVNQVMSLFAVVSNIITAGTGILCAQYIGAGKTLEEKQPLILGSLLVNTVLGILFSLTAVFGGDLLLTMVNIDDALRPFAKEYLNIVGGFLFLQMMAMTFDPASGQYLPVQPAIDEKEAKKLAAQQEKAVREAAKAEKERKAEQRRTRADELREERAERARFNDSVLGRVKNTAIATATRTLTSSLTRGLLGTLTGRKK
jgi:hypothetical protein